MTDINRDRLIWNNLISNHLRIYAVVAYMDMGKPLFNAPDGGRIDILREWEDVTNSELQQGSGT